jgi:hypothetical protein
MKLRLSRPPLPSPSPQLTQTPVSPSSVIKKPIDDQSPIPKCPICLEIPLPPWYSTQCGHIICEACFNKIKHPRRCPTCNKKEAILVRQLALEGILREMSIPMTIPCRHKGCQESPNWTNAFQHHLTCDHRPYFCPIFHSACQWEGQASEMMTHLTEMHHVKSKEAIDSHVEVSADDHCSVIPNHGLVVICTYESSTLQQVIFISMKREFITIQVNAEQASMDYSFMASLRVPSVMTRERKPSSMNAAISEYNIMSIINVPKKTIMHITFPSEKEGILASTHSAKRDFLAVEVPESEKEAIEPPKKKPRF